MFVEFSSASVLLCSQLATEGYQTHNLTPDVQRELDNIHTRLQIWASDVGVFSRGESSLHYRLRDDPDAARLLNVLLDRLKAAIQHIIKPPEPRQEKHGEETLDHHFDMESGDSDSSASTLPLDSDFEIEVADDKSKPKHSILSRRPADEANDILDTMYRLSSLFYDPELEENTRVREYISNNIHDKDTQDIRSDLEQNIHDYLTTKCNRIPKELRERLVSAAFFRRMRLLCRKHQKKLGSRGQANVSEDIDEAKDIVPQSDSGYGSMGSQQGPPTEYGPVSGGQVFEVTVKTQMQHFQPSRSFQPAASLQAPKHGHLPSLPVRPAPPPTTYSAKMRRKKLSVPPLTSDVCPYCLKTIRTEERSRDLWIRHVLKDLSPYVCLFPECGEGDLLFQAREEWLRHMQWSHTLVWQCPVSSHENETFETAHLLRDHLQVMHGDILNDELDEIIQHSKIPAPDTFAVLAQHLSTSNSGPFPGPETYRQCPLSWPQDHSGDSISTRQKQNKWVYGHILSKLEELALRSLPGLGLIDEEDEEYSGSEAADPDSHSSDSDSVSIQNPLPAIIVEDCEEHSRTEPTAYPEYVSFDPSSIQHASPFSPVSVFDRGFSFYKKDKQSGKLSGQIAEPTVSSSEPLVDQLLSLQRTSSDGRLYFPCGYIEALLTEKVVIKALKAERHNITQRQLSDSDIESYAAKICSSSVELPNGELSGYQKLFAILVLLSRTWDIVALIDYELPLSDGTKVRICDAHLPLQAVPISSDGKLVRMRLGSAQDTNLECFAHWPSLLHKNFEDEQWGLLAPYFAQGEKHHAKIYWLSTKDILPWTLVDKAEPLAGGGFSYVSHVRLDPSHHNFDESIMSDGTFAVKHIKTGAYHADADGTDTTVFEWQNIIQADFAREIQTLNMFSGAEQDDWNKGRFDTKKHLINLLVAYQRGDECCLVFRWAQSDLLKMWKTLRRDPPSKADKSSLTWILEQFKGLASAIQRIHLHTTTQSRTEDQLLMPEKKIYGSHGDIKPEKILHFVNRDRPGELGTLVITDFGLCKVHGEDARNYVPKQAIQRTPTYRPPECDMKGSEISRSFDIWSFGCVLLEFLTWYLGGWQLLEEFVNARKVPNVLMHGFSSDQFFELVTPLKETGRKQFIRVKTEVHEFVRNRLHTHPACTDIIHDILKFIMEQMIVVESHGAHNRERAHCSSVYRFLSDQYEKLNGLPDELVFNPWEPERERQAEPVAVEMVLEDYVARTMESRVDQIRKHTGPTIVLPEGVPLDGNRFRNTSPGPGARRTQTFPPAS